MFKSFAAGDALRTRTLATAWFAILDPEMASHHGSAGLRSRCHLAASSVAIAQPAPQLVPLLKRR